MKIRIKESEMVDTFIKKFGKSSTFFKEVPVFAKSVDLVKMEDDAIVAIEFKTTKWRQAEMQALGSAIVFDYLEICVLKPATKECQDLIEKECVNQGIGLYFMDDRTMTFEHVVLPVHRNEVWEIQRKQIYEYLKGRGLD